MRVPIITIIDNSSGYSHRVGSNIHDVLNVDNENGTITYSNLQNGCGSKRYSKHHKPEYRFNCINAPVDDYEPIVEFVGVWEFIKIIIIEWLDERDSRRKLKKYIKKQNRRKRK